MAQNQKRQAGAMDRHRKEIEYKVGNLVRLSTKNIKTKRSLKKLDYKMIVPYKIKKLVGLLCQLDLSTFMKIHNVFHPILLQKALDNPLSGQHNDPAPPVIVDDEEEGEVNDILDARKKERVRRFNIASSGKDTMRIRSGTMRRDLSMQKK